MASWVQTPSGYRCERHGEEFARGKVCKACKLDPGKPIDVTEETNEHDSQLERDEDTFREINRVFYDWAMDLAKGTDRDAHAAAKVAAEGTKALRAACDLREQRAQREHDRMLVRHRREMAGLRKGN